MENLDGSDVGTLGVLLFEKSAMAAAPGDLKVSTDGICGFSRGTNARTVHAAASMAIGTLNRPLFE